VSKIKPFQPIGDSISIREFAEDVRRGLSAKGQKELYSKYLYDEVGSALFDAITVLREYGLTRADARLLRMHAPELAAIIERPSMVAELGSGSGSKTRWILSELGRDHPITYCPIDISETALQRCSRELDEIDNLRIVPINESYLDGLRRAVRLRPAGTSLLLLFLGSSIGNFEPHRAEEFLSDIRRLLLPGDVFCLSADLQKEIDRMILAYDDPPGVTAAFNLNLLARINRELNGNFVLSQYKHEARYNETEHRIEMHLRSTVDQSVTIDNDFSTRFNAGETIWTESSYKFRAQDVPDLAERTGFTCELQWIDEDWPFAQSVLKAA